MGLEKRRFGRFGRRFDKAVAQGSKRRLVSIKAGNITISPLPAVPPPQAPPVTTQKNHFFQAPKPFSAFNAINSSFPPQPPLHIDRQPSSTHIHKATSTLNKPPPLFSTFADLFKKNPASNPPPQPIPASQIGILPLPEPGWTKVSYKKNQRKYSLLSSSKQLPTVPKPKRCFLCGDRSHMAKFCQIGDFKCFACNQIGHTSVCCPNKRQPLLPSIIPPTPAPPPLFIRSVELPESVVETMESYTSFAFFTLLVGNPSVEDIAAGLEHHLNIDKESSNIRPTSPTSYFIQFPNQESLDLACSKDFFDMGSFGGVFVRWPEKIGLKPLPKFIYIWVKISNLPLHLWDTEFLMLLLGDIRDVIAASEDVIFKKKASECKVLMSVKDISEIPRSVIFRYASPDWEHIMEGNISLQAIGKPLSEKQGKELELFESFVRKEGISTNSSDGVPPTFPDPQSLPKSHKEQRITGEGCSKVHTLKGNTGPSIVEGKSPNLNSPMANSPLVEATQQPEEIIKVVFQGVSIRIAKDSWALLSSSVPPIQGDQSAAFISSQQTPIIPQVISSSSNSMEVESQSDPPPGFEKNKNKKPKSHTSTRILRHLPHRKHLAAMKKRTIAGGSKGNIVSSSSSIPLNCMNNDRFNELASNCGVKDPDIPLGLDHIRALERSRANP